MPHRSFFCSPADNAAPMALDLVIDQPAAVAEHFDFALGIQAVLTVSLIEAGLEVVPALETDPDPKLDPDSGPRGTPQILYGEQPRSRHEVWAEIDERRLAPSQLLQLQVYITSRGIGLDARIGPRQGDHTKASRVFVEPGEARLDQIIDNAVSQILHCLRAESTDAPGILNLVGADDAECLALMIPTLGATIRFDFGEGGVPIHREVARANRALSAQLASVAEAPRRPN